MVAGTYFLYPESHDFEAGNFVNDNDNIPSDIYYDCLLYTNNSLLPNYHACLSYEEAVNYSNSTWFAINLPVSQGYFKSTGKIVFDLDLEGWSMHPSNYTTLKHLGTVYYGEKHIEETLPVIGF